METEALDYKMADCQLEEQKQTALEIDGSYLWGKDKNEVWQNEQQSDSGLQIGKESSFNELIQKWEPKITGSALQSQTMSEENKNDDCCEEPNWKFVNSFDNFSSFIKAAGFIEDWIRTKKNNPTDFANDFPAILNRGLLIRKILLHLRKETEGHLIKDQNGALVNPEVKQVDQLIFSQNLYNTEHDYTFYFTINLLEACSLRFNVPVLIIRIALNHLNFLI